MKTHIGPKQWLALGLLGTLSFNLSFNPDSQVIAKNSPLSGSIELASRAPNKIDPSIPEKAEVKDKDKKKGTKDGLTLLAQAETEATEENLLESRALTASASAPTPIPSPSKTPRSEDVLNINLSEYDPNLTGTQVTATFSGNEALYHFTKTEATVCSDCVSGIKTVTLSQASLENTQHIKMIIAKAAMEELKKNKSSSPQATKTASTKASDFKAQLKTDCDRDLDEDYLSCLNDEFTEHLEICSAIDVDPLILADKKTPEGQQQREQLRKAKLEKNNCNRQGKGFFSRYLKSELLKSLSSDLTSETYSKAIDIRDNLLIDLPKEFNNDIKKDLITLSQSGVLQRTYNIYDQLVSQGNTPGYAATLAKNQLALEIRPQANSTGGQLLSALRSSSLTEEGNNLIEAQKIYFSQFYEPLNKFYLEDHTKGFTTMADRTRDTLNTDLDIPRIENKDLPQGISDRRGGSTSGRNSQNLPPSFGTPRVQGSPTLNTQDPRAGSTMEGNPGQGQLQPLPTGRTPVPRNSQPTIPYQR